MQYYLPHIPPQTPPPSPIYAVWLAMVSRPLTDVTFTTRSSTVHRLLTPSLSEMVMPLFLLKESCKLLCHRSLIPPCVVLAPTFCKRRGGVVPRRKKGTTLVQIDQNRRATGLWPSLSLLSPSSRTVSTCKLHVPCGNAIIMCSRQMQWS